MKSQTLQELNQGTTHLDYAKRMFINLIDEKLEELKDDTFYNGFDNMTDQNLLLDLLAYRNYAVELMERLQTLGR